MTTPLIPIDLRTEYLATPLEITRPDPRLMWRLQGAGHNRRQQAWRIQAAGTAAALTAGDLLWDSGRVVGDAISATWGGASLTVFADVHWRVQVWDETGAVGPWSTVARFAVGPRTAADWAPARWLSCPWSVATVAPDFRCSFTTASPVVEARLYATARGIFEATIDGQEINDEVFAPGWTDYKQRLLYRGTDVTALLRSPGEHVIGVRLAEGWFKGPIGWEGQSQLWGGTTEFLLLLRAVHADGSVTVIASDDAWRVANGPVAASTFLRGEFFDAGLMNRDWDRPGYDAKAWSPVRANALNAVAIEPHRAPPVRRLTTLAPIAQWQIRPGVWILDLGQNIAGRVRLTVTAPGGTTIKLRHGEMINPDRTLYVDNLRGAQSTDVYTCAGNGVETYEPAFTFHGFQYVEVSGWPGEPAAGAIIGVVLGTDCPQAGTFSCSEPLLNQLYSNLVWTQRANYLEVPTDCPQK